MIYEGRVNVEFTKRELHLVQLVDVHSCRRFPHRDGEERLLHWLGTDLAERCPDAIKTENPNFVFGIVRRLEKRKPLDVIPVRMSNQQREFYRSRLKFSVESDPERPDAGAGVEHDDLAIRSQFHARRIPAVTQRLRAGYGH